MKHREPTSQECSSNAIVFEDENIVIRAAWYPQMGGYSGKALVEFHKGNPDGCFEAYVWHDGAFPFNESTEQMPAQIHHCMATQFVDFGSKISEWMSDSVD